MIALRLLALSLACACAAAVLSPVAFAGADDDCALYLSAGRSSAYDYSLNLLKGNFVYNGQPNCITYEAINQAYLEARNRILVSQPKGDWKAEDFASVGELVLDISINLAKRYGLTYEEIEKGLPLIDTSKTLIREVCPPIFSHVECRPGKYRRLDGLCNNLQKPTWGATMAPFQRLIGPLFADGINAPRIAHTGRDLPLSRVVSRTMHPDDGFHDHAGTVMVIAWGQFMDHDYTLTGTPLDPINRNDPEECCKRPPHLKHPYCNEIRVPDDDYFYKLFGVKCIDFVRGFPSPRPGCRLGSRVPFNTLTGVIDGNTVYGVTDKFARKLRTGYGGLLRMNPVFKEYGLRDLLPLKLDVPDEGCTRPNKNMYCFEAGEIRVNEQLVLTVMHTLMAREHNRVAEALAAVNPHWDDETLYQEARRINIAEIQHITYNEFLPILLGKDVMEKFGLVLEKEGYWDGYDPNVNPDVLDSFAAAAYRFGHSLLPTAVERWSKAHKFIASKRLSDLIRRPYDLYRAGVMDEYIMGLMNQVAQAMDDSITQEVTNHLFKKVGARFGMDLVSFNMQRGREFGLPGYMEFRKFCGLSDANSFEDLYGSMPNETVRKYQTMFEHPIDIDLWSGGVSERPLPGSMLGPTFACIISTQFSYSRRGDRFWFELPNQPSSFTPEQLHEIRKSRLARIICDNTDIIDTVQLYPMVLPDHELNPRVPCKSGIIPSMDFSKWAEPAPFHGRPSKDFITIAVLRNISNINENNLRTDLDQNQNSNNITVNEHLYSNITSETNTEASILKYNNKKHDANKYTNSTPITNTASNDILLKYISKSKQINQTKSKGHLKNSLFRRKRSPRANEKIVNTQEIPLIVDYQTRHPIQYNNIFPQMPYSKLATNLANFNIETRHEPTENNINNSHEARDSEEHGPPSNNRNEKSQVDREKKSETEDLDLNSSTSKEDSSQESVENNKDNIKYSRDSEQSDEYHDDKTDGLKNKNTINNNSTKHYDQNNFKDDNGDRTNNNRKEKYEQNNSYEDNKSKDSKYDSQNYKHLDDVETIDKNDFNDKKNAFLKNSDINATQRDTSSVENTSLDQSKDDFIENNTKSDQLKDVDLNDFSYERIHINEKGKVEPAKDIYNDNENSPESDTSGQEPDIAKKEALTKNDSSESVEYNSSKEENPIVFQDDVIKPVVELNSEADSGESEEDNSKSNLNLQAPLKTNQHSDKSILSDGSEKNSGQVKQDFERIPLNYKHDNLKKNTPEDENTEKFNSPSYDENLKIKFDDVSIKLPEIKLPEDILSYAHDDPPYSKDKKRFYHYEDDDKSNENPTKNKKYKEDPKLKEDAEEEEKEHDYFYGTRETERYTNNPKNKKEEEEEDLYEKFVRERFGKRGTFEKRSEELQRFKYPELENSGLYKNLQNVLQKTSKLEKEAEKSVDPNAGYMWTLEYGKKLV